MTMLETQLAYATLSETAERLAQTEAQIEDSRARLAKSRVAHANCIARHEEALLDFTSRMAVKQQ